MDFKTIFEHDVYIDDNRVGYIGRGRENHAPIFFGGSKLGTLFEDGTIEINGVRFGHIEENLNIYIHNRLVGTVDEKRKDLRFKLNALTKAIEEEK